MSRIPWSGDTSWQDDPARPPACRTADASGARLFDAIDYDVEGARAAWERVRRAVRICRPCPLVSECLAHALNPDHGVEGVWGGRYFGATDPHAHVRGVRHSYLPPVQGAKTRRPMPV